MDLSMQVEQRTFLRRLDMNFILVVLALNLVGLINLYSATHGIQATDTSGLFISQVIWLVFGWGIFFFLTFVDYQIVYRWSYVIYFLNLFALALVPFIGKISYGARRWLDLGFFSYQPSETMKIALVLVIARNLVNKSKPEGMGLKELALPLILIAVPFILTAKQPDLGTALMILSIPLSMVLFMKVHRRIIIICAVAISIAIPLAWNFAMKDYQKQRIITFLEPGKDPRGAGYNSIQSKIAVGSGKFFGKGFRQGTQSQLEFLPERHTDFIFSVLSEEHGFVGSILTVGLFTILLFIGIGTATQARDKFGALLVIGSLGYVFWHMFINIGMVTGVLPIVGIPLPLLSYGGSGMITTMVAMGFVSSVAYRKFLF
ncbi:MAG: rod shape-determining protein RodA [Bdellovibrionales bacterium]